MYKFTDTIEQFTQEDLPAEAVNFDGKWIEEEIPGYRTLAVSGRELLESEVQEVQIGELDGAKYQSDRYLPRTITVKYLLCAKTNTAFREAFNKLNAVLHKGKCKVVFNDERDKYFMGVKASIEDVPSGRNNVTGKYEIYCTDPFKYAVDKKTYENAGEKIVKIKNEGTRDAFVDIECVLQSDCGGIAFGVNNRIMQIGNFNELDGETIKHSDGVLWSPMTQNYFKAWTDSNVILGNTNIRKTGVMVSNGTKEFQAHTIVENYGDSGTETIYHGPARMIKLADSGTNVSTTGVIKMCCENSGSYTGYLQFCLIGKDDSVVSHIEFDICNPQTQMGECRVYVNGKRRWAFGLTFSKLNGYTGIGAPYISLNKDGDAISFIVGGNTLRFKDPDIVDVEVDRISFQCAKWMSNAAAVNEIYVVSAYKNYAEWKDVPNFFKNQDKIQITSARYEATLNGNPIDIAQGSKPLVAPPGESELVIATSDFATMPEVMVSIREAYI